MKWLAVIDGEQYRLDDYKTIEDPKKQPYMVRECKCQQVERAQKLFESSHITVGFKNAGFKTFDKAARPQSVLDAFDAAREYALEFESIRTTKQNSIALLGDPGAGKTHLLMAVANNLMSRGVSVQYFPWVEGCEELKSDMDAVNSRLSAMKYVDVLFIDDLFKGGQKPSEFEFKSMFGVVNFRNQNHMPILLSSECSIETICAIDNAFGSRIYEMVKDYLVDVRLTDAERARGVQMNYRML